jgi:phosphatidylinositol N-acetylglucosaminyltransferase subunit C
MAPTQAHTSTTTTLPLLTRSTTLPAVPRTVATDRTLLAPEDAIYQASPPRKQSAAVNKLQKELRMADGESGEASSRLPRRGRHKVRNRSGSRRREPWSKLLWVKQSCRFISIIQRNLLIYNRQGQLYRSSYLPRAPPAKPPPSTV